MHASQSHRTLLPPAWLGVVHRQRPDSARARWYAAILHHAPWHPCYRCASHLQSHAPISIPPLPSAPSISCGGPAIEFRSAARLVPLCCHLPFPSPTAATSQRSLHNASLCPPQPSTALYVLGCDRLCGHARRSVQLGTLLTTGHASAGAEITGDQYGFADTSGCVASGKFASRGCSVASTVRPCGVLKLGIAQIRLFTVSKSSSPI